MKKMIKLINNERRTARLLSQKGCYDTCTYVDNAKCSTYAYDHCGKDYAGCQGNAANDYCTTDHAGCEGVGTVDRCGSDYHACKVAGSFDYCPGTDI